MLPAIGFAAVILFLRGGLYKLDRDGESLSTATNAPNKEPPSFSVIIAARNEERNIAACLKTVFAQDIPPDQYEVIVINDRSEDATPEILREFVERHHNLKIITVTETPPGISPKKHAVSTGIKAASNGIIVFTDADCRVLPRWLSTIGKYFNDDDTALVQGITSYSYIAGMNEFFYGLQSIDFLSHGVIAAAAIGADLPINSNANNMAFRKKVFEEVGGYGADSRVTLGDDDHLLQRIWKKGKASRGYKIRYMANPHASVETVPTETLPALFEQRRRWGSVTVHYGARQVALLSAVFLFYLTIPATAAASLFDASFFPVCLSLLFVKLCGELALLIPGTRLFGKKRLRKYILPASLIQLPLVLAAVLTGVFWRFDWKGGRMGRRAGAPRP
jgi:cellulose synthase/poly-beta-1,6-N-acetylglucosamine synthase-like glycosyltransferase